MIPALSINPPEWMLACESRDLMNLLNTSGKRPQALFVGGCVRNAVLGREVKDLDIATQWPPQKVLEICRSAGFRVIPTGIDHGTVTVLVNAVPYEVTTLRRDVSTDGRRATVTFSNDWQEDARRRDFTMNALYADIQGHVYDPLDQGIRDLQACRVVFIGDPAQRIAEDALRILRFFRFHAYYGQGRPCSQALQACKHAAGGIETLSRERITEEFWKILSAPRSVSLLELMFTHNILDQLPSAEWRPACHQKLLSLQDQFNQPTLLPRLYMLMKGPRDQWVYAEKYLSFTNAQKRCFEIYFHLFTTYQDVPEIPVKWLRYSYAEELVVDFLLMLAACRSEYDPATDVDLARNWKPPALPVSGQDVLAQGIEKGPDVGRFLKEVEDWWIYQDFQPDRATCLAKLRELTAPCS